MQHIKSFYLFILIIISAPTIFAQEGTPFITHFDEAKKIESQNWAISQDDQNVMLFANRKGILSFDGHAWKLINLPYIPFALKKSPYDDKVYVGANNNYGYLERNPKGFIEYTSLSDSAAVGIITRIVFTDTTIFFYGNQTITRHNRNNPSEFKRWKAKKFNPFTGMLTTGKNTFFNVFGEGLYRLESDTLFPLVTGFYTKDSEILFSLPYSESRVLVGTDESKLYTFDGIKYYNYNINDEGYLKESILADGQIISDTLYAFGTLYGGVEVVNKKTGKIVYTINYQNGLPDDEIYALGLDNNNGLWITHGFGVSRVDFNLPVSDYSTYPGLSGNLLSSVWHNNQLYVATSSGVYYLTEVKDYNEVNVWVKTSPAQKATKRSTQGETPKTDQEQEKKPVRKLFARLVNRISGTDIYDDETETKQEPKKSQPVKSEPRYIKKTVSKLKSINHMFKKLDGINEKCTQLVSTEHGILAATNNGLYQINDNQAEEIVGNRYINQISLNTADSSFYISTALGFLKLAFEDEKWKIQNNFVNFAEPAYSINEFNHKIWLGSDDQVYAFRYNENGEPADLKFYSVKTKFPEQYRLDLVKDTLYLFLESGLYYFDEKADSFKNYDQITSESELQPDFLLNQQGLPWIKTSGKWLCLANDYPWTSQEVSYLKLFDDITSIIADNKQNLWVINNYNQIFKINHTNYKIAEPDFNIFFNQVKNQNGILFELSDLKFDPENKAISVGIIAPYYVKKNSTQYQYYVEGLMSEWSDWSIDQDINLIVESGEYTLHVRAKDIWENQSDIKTLHFIIKPPFTETALFYILIGLGVIILFIFISKVRERKLKQDKKILERKVKERTIEIEEKAEEIKVQRDEITKQRDEILEQKEEITSSINYALRIQKAILPIRDHFGKAFSDHFILFKPRDIVSGDFYWIAEDKEKTYFAAADCTGHGVPGAFMSMLGISSLNELISSNKDNLTAEKILNLLREKIKYSLHQTGKEGENKDGMDMALCILHKKKNILEYAGAYNPLYLIRNGKLEEYKADRMPVGIYHVEKRSFTRHEVNIKKGDIIYIFSDGYADQFGGPAQTKFKTGNLKKLLIEISGKPMEEQKQILDDRFYAWKRDLEQVDDIILIGIKF